MTNIYPVYIQVNTHSKTQIPIPLEAITAKINLTFGQTQPIKI